LLLAMLSAIDERPVTLLDGDAVRKHISSDLGFSKEDRDLNIRRIATIAAEITKHGGIAICSSIAPYDAARREARRLIEEAGASFLLVHVATPLAVCEQRDGKGLYAKARAGILHQFTGISDPYEIPSDAELVIATTHISAEDAAWMVRKRLEQESCRASSRDYLLSSRYDDSGNRVGSTYSADAANASLRASQNRCP
jgi:sulfate adenylyltransferase